VAFEPPFFFALRKKLNAAQIREFLKIYAQ